MYKNNETSKFISSIIHANILFTVVLRRLYSDVKQESWNSFSMIYSVFSNISNLNGKTKKLN